MSVSFPEVQVVINTALNLVDQVEKIKSEDIHKDAKDFLFSQLKKTVGILTQYLIEEHEIKK